MTPAVSVGIDGTTPPSCVAYFQQRLVYAASNTAPTTFWMSKPGEYANFSTTYPSLSDDAIQATVVNGVVHDYFFGTRTAEQIEDMVQAVRTGRPGDYPFPRCLKVAKTGRACDKPA